MKIHILLVAVVAAVMFYLGTMNQHLTSAVRRHFFLLTKTSSQEANGGDGFLHLNAGNATGTNDIRVDMRSVLSEEEQQEQNRRHELLLNFCKKYHHKPYYSADKSLIYSDRQKVIYCSVAKAACTSWKRVMPVIDGKMADPMDFKRKEDVHRFHHTWLGYVKNETEKARRRKKYFKFFFVRHPFERILSAWRNKFKNPYNEVYQKRLGPKIVKQVRAKVTVASGAAVKDITFEEFIDYIIYLNYVKKAKSMDQHWELALNLCDPCNIQYDFIGKVETLEKDSDQVLKILGLSEKIKFPIGAKDKYKTNIGDIIRKYFSKLSKVTLKKLVKIYENEFIAFGYKLPDYR